MHFQAGKYLQFELRKSVSFCLDLSQQDLLDGNVQILIFPLRNISISSLWPPLTSTDLHYLHFSLTAAYTFSPEERRRMARMPGPEPWLVEESSLILVPTWLGCSRPLTGGYYSRCTVDVQCTVYSVQCTTNTISASFQTNQPSQE